jgi:hypothetical protein
LKLPIEAGMKRRHVGKLARFGKQNSLQVTNAEEVMNDATTRFLELIKLQHSRKTNSLCLAKKGKILASSFCELGVFAILCLITESPKVLTRKRL